MKFSSEPGVGPSDRMLKREMGFASGFRQGLRPFAGGGAGFPASAGAAAPDSWVWGCSTVVKFESKVRIQDEKR